MRIASGNLVLFGDAIDYLFDLGARDFAQDFIAQFGEKVTLENSFPVSRMFARNLWQMFRFERVIRYSERRIAVGKSLICRIFAGCDLSKDLSGLPSCLGCVDCVRATERHFSNALPISRAVKQDIGLVAGSPNSNTEAWKLAVPHVKLGTVVRRGRLNDLVGNNDFAHCDPGKISVRVMPG